MADGKQARVFFPGIPRIVSCTFSQGHGVSPSAGRIEILPRDIPTGDIVGDLRLEFDGKSVTFPDCKIDSASRRRTTSGDTISLVVHDRRWKWQQRNGGGSISGTYNLRDSNNEIIQGTEKTPQDLAKLLLKAMDEGDYIIESLPNDARPRVEWTVANPANELALLVESMGCRIRLAGTRVIIDLMSDGESIPLAPIVAGSGSIARPAIIKPKNIIVYSSPARFQCDLELEAVGIETDGTLKLIDELSYKPASGWTVDGLASFENLSETDAKRIAAESVLKLYRVKIPAAGLKVPDYETPLATLKELELLAEQVETIEEFGIKRPKPAIVYGLWEGERDDGLNTATAMQPYIEGQEFGLLARYSGSFSIDTERKLVRFSQVVTKNGTETTTTIPLEPATLRLRTSIHVLDATTREYIRLFAKRPFGGENGTLDRSAVRSEVTPTFVPTYDNNFNVTATASNRDEVERELDYYVDGIEREYQRSEERTARYNGIVPIELSGRILQVTYSVGRGPAWTEAHENNETSPYQAPYRDRRARELAGR